MSYHTGAPAGELKRAAGKLRKHHADWGATGRPGRFQ
jgi:hypothetical protein